MIHRWTIEEQDVGARLDVFLSAQMEEKTRSNIAKFLKRGAGTVNGKKATVHRFLKVGDTVEFEDDLSVIPVKTGIQNKRNHLHGLGSPDGHRGNDKELKIIEETPDWLVIDKPAGILVHPDRETLSGTLVDLVLAHVPSMAKVGEDPSRPGIMHRLDKEVSGLMVLAKTQDAFDHLKKQFAEHSVDKTYLALVHGEVTKDEGDIKFRIARSTSKARMAARPEHEKEGKAAWTHYKVLKRFRAATLLELQIFSGRTHQIRAHLLALGNPVAGDPLYTMRQTDRKLAPKRILLQSVNLAFTDPKTGERKHYTLPPDPVFADVMKSIKPHEPSAS